MNNLARTIHPTTGNASLINVVRHLRGSLNCAGHEWAPLQREAAEQAVAEAEELLGIDASAARYEAPRGYLFHLKLVEKADPLLPLYLREFPTFPIITEAIPEGFVDASWHNNACPSFDHVYADESILTIYLDWPKPEDREWDRASRYSMSLRDAQGDYVGEAVNADSWQEIITALGLFPEIKVQA